LGVPTIELSDFKGIPDDDHKYSLRNNNGEAIREYRYLNLVLGASTYPEFKKHITAIFNDKRKIVNKLQRNYRKVFVTKRKINNLISDEIKNEIL